MKRWVNIERAALRKLEQLYVSVRLDDLRVPPGNRLELLKGSRAEGAGMMLSSLSSNDLRRVAVASAIESALV